MTSINYAWNKWQSVKVPGEEAPNPAWSTRKSFLGQMRPELLLSFSHSVMSSSLRSHKLQHTRLPWPSSYPAACWNSWPSSRWCHPIISPSVIPFSCPQSLPASGTFQMSQLFASCGQSIGVSASTSVLLMDAQNWSPLGWTGWISLQSKGLSRVFMLGPLYVMSFKSYNNSIS